MMRPESRWQSASGSSLRFILSASTSAFLVYFCMYAFRKPFAVGIFDDVQDFAISYKVVLVLAQLIGYASSKFIGIKVISELTAAHRPWMIIALVLVAELALLGFALVPPPYNFVLLFFNGLPLGMIWGLVFSYLEGRRTTELLAAILSSSFILASGVTKAVGKYIMLEFAVSQYWMPFVTGALFLLPLFLSVWWLNQVPAPTPDDIRARHVREAMTSEDRRRLLYGAWPGLLAIVVMYFFLTAFRDYRDNFAADIFNEIGLSGNFRIFAETELWVAVLSLLIMASFILIRNNLKAVQIVIAIMAASMLLLASSTYFYQAAILDDPFWWIVLVGLGAYIAYIPVGSMLFERLIACLRYKSNAGFLIYIADAMGYVGSILVMLYQTFVYQGDSILAFFIQFSYLTALIGFIGLGFAFVYFSRVIPAQSTA
ncbi:MAG TPA: hypothetical protein EYF99_14915 [Pseudomonadales bacterium]|nr:hypothetical protein [Pseudomonadales bacterium]